METAADTARIVNALAERWATELGGTGSGGTVLTAVGVWPLLGFLAAGADGAARKELEEALGLPAEEAARRGRELLALLRDVPGAGAAVGLWTAGGVRPDPGWLAEVGRHTRGTLKGVPALDRLVLDRWARKHTGGLVRSMPLEVDRDLLLVLASAVAVRTRWRRAFQETWQHADSGPWAAAGSPHCGSTAPSCSTTSPSPRPPPTRSPKYACPAPPTPTSTCCSAPRTPRSAGSSRRGWHCWTAAPGASRRPSCRPAGRGRA
ncbi:serpin family protein [Kitasatospora arboriphila]